MHVKIYILYFSQIIFGCLSFGEILKLIWIDPNPESECWRLVCIQKISVLAWKARIGGVRRGAIHCYPFIGLHSQVETWRVDVGERLAPNHYKSFVFVVFASLFLFFVLITCLLLIYVWFYFYCKLIYFTLHLGTLLK